MCAAGGGSRPARGSLAVQPAPLPPPGARRSLRLRNLGLGGSRGRAASCFLRTVRGSVGAESPEGAIEGPWKTPVLKAPRQGGARPGWKMTQAETLAGVGERKPRCLALSSQPEGAGPPEAEARPAEGRGDPHSAQRLRGPNGRVDPARLPAPLASGRPCGAGALRLPSGRVGLCSPCSSVQRSNLQSL